jgi:uncharacterized membrane protein
MNPNDAIKLEKAEREARWKVYSENAKARARREMRQEFLKRHLKNIFLIFLCFLLVFGGCGLWMVFLKFMNPSWN